MITVNLRPDLKRKRARKPFTGSLDGLRGLGSKVKDPLLLVAVVAWVSVLGWLAFVYMGTTRELNALTPQLEASRSENRRFKAFLTEKRHQETIRDSLVAQIGVIRTVDADRYVWPHPTPRPTARPRRPRSRCRSRSTAAPSISRPTPSSSASSRPRRGSPT
jgi:hypothetical protein